MKIVRKLFKFPEDDWTNFTIIDFILTNKS